MIAQTDSVKAAPLNFKKPGLTLSGGGAKGLAHIGVLYVLDSLGIKVSYISGTSMGSIIGGMYAAGYTAKEIETFALNINWAEIFSPEPSLQFIPPQKRSSAGKNLVELSLENGKIQLPTGAIEGQQLWNTLNEIFLPMYRFSNFEQLPIPFACVATNLGTGEAVVMKNGNLASAIRASMAIPSIFTTVERDGMKLIDGGVVQNFPVSILKDMGADYVIGVNVSTGLLPARELKNPFDVIYQMGFYVAAQKFSGDFKLVDIYIEPDLSGYSASSFAKAAEMIEKGKIAARKQLPELIKLAQYLKTMDTLPAKAPFDYPHEKFVLDTTIITGNKHINNRYILSRIHVKKGDSLLANDFTREVENLYASDYFHRINYHLTNIEKTGNVCLNIDVSEKTPSQMMAAVNFSSFTGVGLIAGWQTNRFFFNSLHASGKIQIGKNPVMQAGISYYLSENQKNWLELDVYGYQLKFPIYQNFEAIAEYKKGWIQPGLSINKLTGSNSYLTLGTSFFYQELKPTIITLQTVKGNNKGFESYLRHRYISLNRNAFPGSGQDVYVQLALLHNQKTRYRVSSTDGEALTSDYLDLSVKDFVQATFGWDIYIPFNDRATQIIKLNGAYNFGYNEDLVNSFNIGGTNKYLHKQQVFMGLNEYEVLTNAVLSGAFGLQYKIGSSLYASWLINAATYDFDVEKLDDVRVDENFIFGGGLSLGYDSLLGPIEITISYSPQTDKILSYLTLGWHL